MELNTDDTGVLLILSLVNVASLGYEGGKLIKTWGLYREAQHCHLTGEYKNAYSKLSTSPNAEGLKTNHHYNKHKTLETQKRTR